MSNRNLEGKGSRLRIDLPKICYRLPEDERLWLKKWALRNGYSLEEMSLTGVSQLVGRLLTGARNAA